MAYPQTIRYLESFVNYEKKTDYSYKGSLKLERLRDFLRIIGDPQDELRCIHVAGTKGKGSTCAFTAYILRAAGFKVGLYTSPHLTDFRERIRILSRSSFVVRLPRATCNEWSRTKSRGRPSREDFEGMISKKELSALVTRLRPGIDRYNRRWQYGPLTFFEVCTALAFVYFLQKKVDFAVLETGLGGRLDATNTAHPLVTAITPISYEHTQMLGKTLAKIAREKAGIIKRRPSSVYPERPVMSGVELSRGVVRRPLIVISAPQKEEAARVIRKKCRKERAQLREVGRDIKIKIGEGSRFKVQGLEREYAGLRTRLLGRHQVVNAAVAVGIVEALKNYGIKIGAGAIKAGLNKTVWPGRCEVIHRRPWVILDGAQNAASAETIKDALRRNFSFKLLFLILGVSNDKDIQGICRQVCPIADKIILTRSTNPRAAKIADMERVIRSLIPGSGKDIIRTENTGEAIDIARALAGKQDLILATGSLFVVGEIRNELNAS
ncbi:MAG: folylpolyglutamate synthase/dihydrofolate synthase family protein [Candidatus Omnitrophota bacterium]|nr:folylpolyglutamate synthase/dihydrofolate synthase family protein [Candidatus Omnitrophota bacterium]